MDITELELELIGFWAAAMAFVEADEDGNDIIVVVHATFEDFWEYAKRL
jgi:hypothetical protein